MTERSAPPRAALARRRLISVAAAAVILAVLAGVYGIARLRSNPAADACAGAVATAGRLAPLAHGEVAALAVAQAPFLVPDLAFKDADGRERTLKDWRGRTVLLNLWATWCVPCRKEMPALDALERELGGPKFEVVAVNIDTRYPDKPRSLLMPTTLIVDGRGCELGAMAGPAEWAGADGVKLVSAAIAGGPD